MPNKRSPDVVVDMSEAQDKKLSMLNHAAKAAQAQANAYLEAIIDGSDAMPANTPITDLEVKDGEVRLWFPALPAADDSDAVEE